jgi:4-hydroxythreonine-4-phosphate dehydrogenase
MSLLITCGDVNGIGPELALKILTDKNIMSSYDIKLIIPDSVMDFYSNLLKIKRPANKDIINIPDFGIKIKPGKIDYKAGRIAGDAIRIGTEFCLRKNYKALVTLPISKKSFNLAGYDFPGHTEYLSTITGCEKTIMIMYSEKLVVTPVTIHVPLKSVTKVLGKKLLRTNIEILCKTLKENFKIDNPKIALLSVNPHNGDGGLHGIEEKTKIEPVIKELKNKGISVSGPFPADGFFGTGAYKNYHATAGMYHDQVLVPFKIISGGLGVNFTAGLSIVRTSPTHGTAFDIAGKGIASADSTAEAIKLASKLVL